MAQDTMDQTTNECNQFHAETYAAGRRAELYRLFTDYFGLAAEENTGCKDKILEYGGAQDLESNWFEAG